DPLILLRSAVVPLYPAKLGHSRLEIQPLSPELKQYHWPRVDESATATENPDWVPNPRDKVVRRRPAAQVFRERRFSGSRYHGRVLQFFATGTQLLEQRQCGAGEEQPCADS